MGMVGGDKGLNNSIAYNFIECPNTVLLVNPLHWD